MRRLVNHLVLSLYVTLLASNVARGQDTYEVPPAPQFISNLGIDEKMFDVFCDALQLDAAQRADATQLHQEYLADAEAYSKDLYERMLDAGLREYWRLGDEAMDKREPMPTERLNELHRQQARVKADGMAQADQQITDFYAHVAELLSPQQAERMVPAQRLMRRLNWYQRHMAVLKAPRAMHSDFMLGRTDPFELWDSFTKDWPERDSLHRSPFISTLDLTDPATIGEDDPLRQASATLREALETYEVQIDTVVRDRLDQARRPPDPDAVAVGTRPASSKQRGAARWSEEYRIFDRCLLELAEAARLIRGDDAALAFHDAWLFTFCPELTHERWPDRMVAWLESRADATPEQLDAARELDTSYTLAMRHQIDLAVEAGVEAMRRHLNAYGDTPEHIQFQKRKLDMRVLVERTLLTFRTLLRPEQVGDFDDQCFADIYMHYGELIGPTVSNIDMPPDRLFETLKPPTSLDELDRRAEEKWKKLEEEKRAHEQK